MLGRREAGRRRWELLPILFLALFAAQPRVISAQTPGLGVPANGPTAQLFSSAGNSFLSTPPPPVPLSPPPPPPPASPPPPPPILRPPPPAQTTAPTVTPAAQISPPPAPTPSPTSRSVSPPPTATPRATPSDQGSDTPGVSPTPTPTQQATSQPTQSPVRSPPPPPPVLSPPPPAAPILSPPPPNPVSQPSPTALAISPPPLAFSPPPPSTSSLSPPSPNIATPGITRSAEQNSVGTNSNPISPPPSPTRAVPPSITGVPLSPPPSPTFTTPASSNAANGSFLSTPGLSVPTGQNNTPVASPPPSGTVSPPSPQTTPSPTPASTTRAVPNPPPSPTPTQTPSRTTSPSTPGTVVTVTPAATASPPENAVPSFGADQSGTTTTTARNATGQSALAPAPAQAIANQTRASPPAVAPTVASTPTPTLTNPATPGLTNAPARTAPAVAPVVSTRPPAASPPEQSQAAPGVVAASAPAVSSGRPAVAPAPLPRNLTTPSSPVSNIPSPAPAISNQTLQSSPAPAPRNQSEVNYQTAPAPAPRNATAPAPQPASVNFTGRVPAQAPAVSPRSVTSSVVETPAPVPVKPLSGAIPAPQPGPPAALFPIIEPNELVPAPAPAPSPGPIPNNNFLPAQANYTSPAPAPAPAPSPAMLGPGVQVPANQPNSPAEAPMSALLAPGPAPSPAVVQETGNPMADSPFLSPQADVAPAPSPDAGRYVGSPAPGPSGTIGTVQRAPALAPANNTLAPAPAPENSPDVAVVTASSISPNPSPAAAAPNTDLPVFANGPASSPSADTAGSPAPGPASGDFQAFSDGLGPSMSPFADNTGLPTSPGNFFTSQVPMGAFSPGPSPALAPQLPQDPIAYSARALSPALEAEREFIGGPALAPSPSYPSWMAGAQKVGTDLYVVQSGENRGFYTVINQPNGDTTETYAFATVPIGSNVNSFQPNNLNMGLTGYGIYPFNETYQAVVMNQLHVALDDASIPHTIKYNSTTLNSGGSTSPSAGRKLLQSNPDNITSTVSSSPQTATLDVRTQDNVTVGIIVSVAPGDQNNLTAIVNDAIFTGQVRRGLLAAGANVTNAVVTGVSSISNGNSAGTPTTPSNTASPSPQSSSGVSGAVIGGAVGGGCAAVAVLAIILYRVHVHKMKKHMADLEASPAAKLSDSSSEEGYPYRRNGQGKYIHSSNGTSDSGDRPHYIKTVKGGMQDVVLLSSGYTGSMESPYAHSVQPREFTDRTSPDSPGWEEYRQKILTGIEKAASKHSLSHKIDANLWQVQWSDIELRGEIGGGSFGKVHIAKWRETTVAVKVLGSGAIPEDKNSPVSISIEHSTLMNLEKEASMMASMRHPNVVMYIGVCLEVPALVTEYCARGSLHDVLRKWKHRPEQVVNWSRRIGMVLDAAKGMNYLHSSEPPVIHRDLKSPNLLVDKHWNVKICDFNLSKAIEETANVMSSLCTTNPRWLAPEIISGKDYTFSSDVYSFGLIMWEMLTWTVPWSDITHWQCVHVVTEQKARPEIPTEETLPGPPGKQTFSGFPEYVELMQQCWDQEPSRRPKFPHIIEVLRRLMATEAGHKDGRSSSLGTDQLTSSGFLSMGNSTNQNGISLHSTQENQSTQPSQRSSLVTTRNSPTENIHSLRTPERKED